MEYASKYLCVQVPGVFLLVDVIRALITKWSPSKNTQEILQGRIPCACSFLYLSLYYSLHTILTYFARFSRYVDIYIVQDFKSKGTFSISSLLSQNTDLAV